MQTLFRSAEIRWFMPGEPPAAVDTWFRQKGTARVTPERVDRYLVLPGSDAVGVKLREGRFEIKARMSQPEPVEYAAGMRGFRDTWVKWSRDINADIDRWEGQPTDECWAFVRKRRLLRLLSLESGSPAEVESDGVLLSAGCQLELSKLTLWFRSSPDETEEAGEPASASAWWSLSLEAFGTPGTEPANLDQAAATLFQDGTGVPLGEDTSMAYPDWLDGLAAR